VLQAAWHDIGRPELYVGPDKQEQKDLSGDKNRSRGEKAQRKRLKRGWQHLERERLWQQPAAEEQPTASGPALPHYLLERGEWAQSAERPAWLLVEQPVAADSDGSSNEDDEPTQKLQRRVDRWSNNSAAQDARWEREHYSRMARRAAAATAWDAQHGARRDAELERVMAMRERGELDYFWAETRPRSPEQSKWKLRDAKCLDADATRTLGVNELNVDEPILLYLGFIRLRAARSRRPTIFDAASVTRSGSRASAAGYSTRWRRSCHRCPSPWHHSRTRSPHIRSPITTAVLVSFRLPTTMRGSRSRLSSQSHPRNHHRRHHRQCHQ
jgi:hypothetical protein